MTKSTVGFIGLGVMGKPMARNLLKAGYPLVGHDRGGEPVEELAAEGAKQAFSPGEVASRSELIITTLPCNQDPLDVQHLELLSKGKNTDLLQEVEESIQEPYFIETTDGIEFLATVNNLGHLLVVPLSCLPA